MASKVIRTRPRFILVSDLDWTMVDHSDKENKSLLAFNKLWAESFAKDSMLVFSTGRSYALYAKLREEAPLAVPDVLVCSVGTEIFFETDSGNEPVPDQQWSQLLDQGWNRQAIAKIAASFPGLTLQEETEQRPHKISFHVSLERQDAEQQLEKLRALLSQQGLPAKVIYSGGADLDILPQTASKGKGLEFLLNQIKELVGEPPEGVLVNGDSGNDIELFAVPGVRGTVVANAHSELKEWVEANPSPLVFMASQRCAGGIIESLKHFELVKR